MRGAWPVPGDRSWRGRPAVPALAFDRRSAAHRQAAARLPLVVAGSLGLFALVEPALTGWIGGWWGELAALAVTGAPMGTAWAAAARGTGLREAWKTGALFAFASAALYAWIFSGAWGQWV